MRSFALIVIAAALLWSCSRPAEDRTRKRLKVTGTVLEHVDGPPYSYLRIETDAGEVWAMVPSTSVAANERVTVVEGVFLSDFDTGISGRRFDIVMGTLDRRR